MPELTNISVNDEKALGNASHLTSIDKSTNLLKQVNTKRGL